ncbi:MAG: RCC1 domain-containing protein, partial [Planctomycetota bacterium]
SAHWPTDFGNPPPQKEWGLAECSNYQFLSYSTVFKSSGLQSFPHPAKGYTDVEWYANGPGGARQYYRKGYDLPHLARVTYTTFRYWFIPLVSIETSTTEETSVYKDYAKSTIPRTIDYTTGLINYFFRGRLNVEITGETATEIELTITNTSDNSDVAQTLKGGTFEIYWDDENDDRTQITSITFDPTWGSSSTLPNDGGVSELLAKFDPPTGTVKQYVVVYKGNINENPADPDPDDTEAIAVGITFEPDILVAWGNDDYGQVSDKPEGSDFISVAAGLYHGLALKSDGSIVGWGLNDDGQATPPPGNDFIAISAGLYHSIALKSDGSIVGWGINDGSGDDYGQVTSVPAGNDYEAIAAGDYHNLALKTDGTIVAWGRNDKKQCTPIPNPDPGEDYTAIAVGSLHSLALQSNSKVKAWGDNTYGQADYYTNDDIIAIDACGYYNLLLRKEYTGTYEYTLISWGNNDWLFWPNPPFDPGQIRYHYRLWDGTVFDAIAAGWDHFIALTADGEIWAWDWPYGNPLYYSYDDDFKRVGWVPSGIIFTDNISAGYEFCLALKAP